MQTKQDLQKESKAPTTGLASRPQTGFKREIEVRGGVIRDGVYIPNKE